MSINALFSSGVISSFHIYQPISLFFNSLKTCRYNDLLYLSKKIETTKPTETTKMIKTTKTIKTPKTTQTTQTTKTIETTKTIKTPKTTMDKQMPAPLLNGYDPVTNTTYYSGDGLAGSLLAFIRFITLLMKSRRSGMSGAAIHGGIREIGGAEGVEEGGRRGQVVGV